MRNLLRALWILVGLAVLPTTSGVIARAQAEREYVWCNVEGTDFFTGGRASYFSEVFYGPSGGAAEGNYNQAFRNYIAANYARVLGPVNCRSNPELGEARSDMDAAKARSIHTVIQTGWTYE